MVSAGVATDTDNRPEPAETAGNGNDTYARRHFLRNAALLALENAGFVVAITFVGTNTILPTFVTELGGSALLVGLLATCQSAGWLLPQLVGAGLVAGKPRMLPYILIPLYVGRPAFLVMAGLIILAGTRFPWLLLVALYVSLLGFYGTDGLASVPWYELVGKTVPPSRRGRMFGIAQVAGGLAGMGVGWLVGVVLRSPSLTFPRNYAVLFALSGVVFLLNLLPFLFMKEPAGAPSPGSTARHRSWREFTTSLLGIIREDRNFVRLVVARLLLGLATASFPFYILFMDGLSASPGRLGLLTSAQVAGGLAGGLAVGWLADHVGTRTVIRWSAVAGALIPGVGLAMGALGSIRGSGFEALGVVLFFLMGMAGSTNMIGFMNYLLEVAPLPARTTYVGLFNTLSGVVLVAPPLAGWIVQAASYQLLFALAILGGIASLLAALGLSLPERTP